MNDTIDPQQLELAANILARSRYAIALVGAGMSVESGIPPFRGAGGLWTKRGEPPMDGYQRFLRDPEQYWANRVGAASVDDEFVRALIEAKPNPGHYALAEMEREGLLKHVITQNIDNLHVLAGSVALTEIHGNRTKLRCIGCNRRWPVDEFPIETVPPRCPGCGALVKGDTVMFGEPIPPDALEACARESRQADCMLVIGTSAVVYPAAQYPIIVYERGGALIEINIEDTPLTPYCAAVLRGPSAQVLPRLLERAQALRAAGA